MSNKDTVKELLEKETTEEVITVVEGDFNALKVQAQNFIKVIENVIEMEKVMVNREKLSTAVKMVKERMNTNQNYTRQIIDAQHIFDMNINAFLGRDIYLTYVHKDGGLSFYNEVNVGKLYHNYITKGVGVGKLQKSLPENWSDLEKALNERIKASAAEKAWTYVEATRRWEKNNTNDKKKRMRYKDSYQTFYWRLYDSHHVTGWTDKITNKGHIAEAYANGVINEDSSINANRGDYALLKLYEKIRDDSKSGVEEGDIQLKEDGSIHFAIKSGNFQTARSVQYVYLAYNIARIPAMSKEEFKKNLYTLLHLDSGSEDIVQKAQEKAKKEIKEVAESVTTT